MINNPETDKFCTTCGHPIERITVRLGYNGQTGEELTTTRRGCVICEATRLAARPKYPWRIDV